MGKEDLIIIRVQKFRKDNWKKLCLEKQISLTSLIIDSVENRLMNDERRKVLAFIEKQDNIFGKIETNINQVAKIVNGQKFISENELQKFSNQLTEITKLKVRQNGIFLKIYSILGK
ncbi:MULTISPECIES: hypothetical protein [Empedobacter]|mgnify:FL=1|uniref:hypothetical protein n=1 Tax=Empedobacter TaxID=59734 RepID=UPI002577CEEF|nr:MULTISPECIES: hypothetical protein [Empedobacter]MDM1040159.1 hypothetical protein [Empedobacter brevis]MDM1134091.1 hypothetical protein [Empedobacter sp. R750]